MEGCGASTRACPLRQSCSARSNLDQSPENRREPRAARETMRCAGLESRSGGGLVPEGAQSRAAVSNSVAIDGGDAHDCDTLHRVRPRMQP